MGARARMAQVVSDLVGFAKVVSASLGASSSTELKVSATEDDKAGDSCELWGHSPLLYKPLAGSEVLYATLGSERVVIATKERRFQISVADGEVIVRAVGAGSPAYVHLKPDGSAIIKANTINLGGAAVAFVALATLVDARLSAIVTWLNTHVHTSAAPASPTSPPVTPITPQATVAATKTKAE